MLSLQENTLSTFERGGGVREIFLLFLKENVRIFKKNCELTSYTIILGQRIFFSIIKLVFRGKQVS